jgi:hypothetical protein
VVRVCIHATTHFLKRVTWSTGTITRVTFLNILYPCGTSLAPRIPLSRTDSSLGLISGHYEIPLSCQIICIGASGLVMLLRSEGWCPGNVGPTTRYAIAKESRCRKSVKFYVRQSMECAQRTPPIKTCDQTDSSGTVAFPRASMASYQYMVHGLSLFFAKMKVLGVRRDQPGKRNQT